MKITSRMLVGSVISVAFLLPASAAMAAAKDARVTQIIRDVKLLPTAADPRPATVNDKVAEDTGVRTGGESRSELTFSDLTITRLGANTIFSFSKAGRTAKVDSGSILLRVPKDSGGGTIKNNAVTVAVTGTTVIFEANRGRKLITLEGSARVSLTAKPREFRNVLAGQMIDVPPGATTLPMPVNVDLNDVMRNHPLITDFKPLPSQPLIMAAAQQQPPAPPPTYTGPQISIDIFGGGTRHHGPRRDPRRPPTNPPPSNQPPSNSDGDPKPPPPVTNRTPGSVKVPPTTSTTTIPRTQRTPTKKPTPPPGPR
jgi:hypothetical protein